MLEELQSLSAASKKRVLVIATIIIMAIVIGVWVVYFNSIIAGTSQQIAVQATSSAAATPAIPTATAAPQASDPGLWQNIKDGFGFIANIFKKPSQYNVQPQNN
jgi:flagellar basal body-associated protein FliL